MSSEGDSFRKSTTRPNPIASAAGNGFGWRQALAKPAEVICVSRPPVIFWPGILLVLAAAGSVFAAEPRAQKAVAIAGQVPGLRGWVESGKQEAFRNFRAHQTEYAGPGREDPEPTEVKEVLIGYFGPSDPAHCEGGDLWQAAQMAIEEANSQGGYKGKAFRLVPAWSDSPWSAGVAQIARIVYREKVWALVGGIDGPSTHLAEQVIVKARLALVSPVSTDKTVNLVNVPWMFSCAPGDHLLAPLLAEALAQYATGRPFVVLSADDHDSKLLAMELAKLLTGRRLVPARQFVFSAASLDLQELIERTLAPGPRTVVIVASARPSAALVSALRRKGFEGAIYGGPSMGRRRFLHQAGSAAEGVVFPLVCDVQSLPASFVKAFRMRFGFEPDYAAAQTYDAVRMLLAAIGKAGLNRARIRDALHELSPWQGVTGVIAWDPAESNTRRPVLGTIRQSRVERL